MEQVKGIEPSTSAWEADVLPLNYTCVLFCCFIIPQSPLFVKPAAGFAVLDNHCGICYNMCVLKSE